MKEETEAYVQGREAGMTGQLDSDNPYTIGTDEAMYWPKGQDLDEDIADSLGPVSNKRKSKKALKRKAPEPEVVAQPTVFALDVETDPVWSIDSTGELGCIVEGQYVMVLSPKHAASLNRFMQATNGVHANKDPNAI